MPAVSIVVVGTMALRADTGIGSEVVSPGVLTTGASSCDLSEIRGGLIQTSAGSVGGWGGPLTKRSGCSRYARRRTCLRPAMISSAIAIVYRFRSQHAQSRVAMLGVVVGEKLIGESTGVFEPAEAIGEVRTILEGFELRLGVRVVVRHVGP